MPSRFLNNITVNDEYTLPSADGTADQIITTDGEGQLSFVDQSTLNSGSASRTEILVKNLEGSSLSKGDPVYIIGSVGASERLQVGLADAGNSAKMPCVGLLTQDLAINGEGTAIVTGKLKNLITSPIDGATPIENDTIYVKSGGGLTLTKPTGSTNLIQNVGQVGRVSTSADGNIVVAALLRTNDVPNLPTGRLFVGTAANTSLISDVVYVDDALDRVGIGTTSPSSILHLEDEAPKLKILSNQSYGSSIIEMGNGSSPTSGLITCYSNPSISALELLYDNGATGDARIRVGQRYLDFQIDAGSTMYINSSKNVGIGTTSPSYKLDVDGAARFGDNQGILLTDDSGTSYVRALNNHLNLRTTRDEDDIYFSTGTTTTTKMFIQGDTGNVGIGTTSPAKKLTIGGIGIGNTDGLKIEDPSNAAYGAHFSFDDGSTTVEIGGVTNNTLNDCISIARDATRTITIDTSERVGIGTPTPTQKLEVAGEVLIKNNSLSYLYLNNTGNFLYGDTFGHTIIRTANTFRIQTGTTERVRVTSAGNVGIGTTSPGDKLVVQGDGDGILVRSNDFTLSRIIPRGQTSTNWDKALFSLYNAAAENVRIDTAGSSWFNGGNVGIGTTSPSFQLQLSTNSAAKPSSNVWTVTSDYRVKENIRDYTTGLEAILKIEPKLYDYNGKAGFEKTKDNIGIIAQDIQNVMPETIKTYNTKLNEDDTEDTELLNFDGHAVTFALINAVKDLKAEIEELKKQINK